MLEYQNKTAGELFLGIFLVNNFRGCLKISKKELDINEEIKDKEIRVVANDGSQLGLMQLEEALDLAFSQNLDLVKIAPLATPPVCKIMNYGKFKFEQTKKEKEAKKNQKTIDIKEVRLSISIDVNDFNTKVKNTLKFLKTGNRVKVCVRLKGREMSRSTLGFEILEKFKQACEEFGFSDKPAKAEGRSVILILSPKTAEGRNKVTED